MTRPGCRGDDAVPAGRADLHAGRRALQHWRLPDLAPGHVLAIMDAGAYFVPFSTTFSFPKPAIVLQDGPELTVLRRAETSGDGALDVTP